MSQDISERLTLQSLRLDAKRKTALPSEELSLTLRAGGHLLPDNAYIKVSEFTASAWIQERILNMAKLSKACVANMD